MKKAANIVEIVVEILALILFFTMKGTTSLLVGSYYRTFEGPIFQTLHMVPVYAGVFYTLWGLNLVMCIVSAVSKDQRRDGLIHSILPVLMFAVTDFILLSFTESVSNPALFHIMMAVLVVVSFVKRSNFINPER